MAGNRELVDTFGIAGKVAVIVGAASGLAQETARLFAAAGARLVLGDVNEAGLAETAALVEREGGQASCHRADASRLEDMEALADAAIAEAGRVDIWVNSAGVSYRRTILDADPDKAAWIVGVNMMGPLWGCKAAGRVMRDQGKGAIINVSSTGGAIPLPGSGVYAMTKAAVNSLTMTCAAEFGPFGLRVNAVAPGYVETNMSKAMYSDENGKVDEVQREQVIDQMKSIAALGIVGERSDIASAILYLASDASKFVTGQVLAVNGGANM